MQENKLKYKLGNYFSTWFEIDYEIWSVDRTKRIDIVMVHKSDTNTDYPFGIECKDDSIKKGKDIAKWLKQTYSYSKKEFEKYGKLITLCFPRISHYHFTEGEYIYNHTKYDEGHNVNTFLGQFNIGEIIPDERDYKKIVYSGSVLWHQNRDDLRIHNIKKVCKDR